MNDARMLVADLHGLAGRIGELRTMPSELAGASRSEDGCESFRVLGAEEPAGLVLLSMWKNEAALRAHYDTPHYRRYRARVGPLLARPSDVTIFHVGETIRALDPNPPDPETFD
jgi:quinol monooxygenase YgiN